MKIVYFGTPQFAAHVLKYLIDQSVEITAVISRTDKPKGRSKTPVATPVKQVALDNHIPVFQPEKVSSEEFKATSESLEADLFVVVAYGEILKQHVLDTPKKGCINVHASLLPKYRGAAPIQWAIINGESESGISIMHMVRKMDAGNVISQRVVSIDEQMTFGELEEKLCHTGCKALMETIHAIELAPQPGTPQDENLVTYAPKIELEDCEINWTRPAKEIHNLVRGVNPYPGSWSYVSVKGERKRLKIFRAEVLSESGEVGSCRLVKGEPIIFCGSESLVLKEVQLEGKKRMVAKDLFLGIPIDQFSILEL